MFARVSFSCLLVFAVLLCQTRATQNGALRPCQTAVKKSGRILTSRRLASVQFFKDKDGSGVQSRRLMQDVSCEWDAEEEECGISGASLAKLFLESTSPVGQVIGQIGTCAEQSRKRQCKNVGYCFWDRPECTFADFSIGNEDSPCVKHAPGLFVFLAASNKCETHERRAVCKAPTCEWNREEGVCDADILETLLASGDTDAETPEELIDSLEGEGDRQFMRTVLDCVEQEQASCTGDCEWDTEDGSCGISPRVVFGAMVPEDYTSGDGVCDLMSFFAQTDCLSYGTQTECLADETCEYDENSCGPDVSALIGNVIFEDPDLGVQVAAAGEACGSSTTEDECA